MHHFMPESIHIFRSRRYDDYDQDIHLLTCPVDRDKVEVELTLNIKKAISPEESAPKQKHVHSKQQALFGAWHCLIDAC